MLTYNYIRVHARRHLPSAVPWISEDRLSQTQRTGEEAELSDGHEGGVDADEEGEEVGEGGDGDADACLGEGHAHSLRDVHVALYALAPRGHQQEHVVHSDACPARETCGRN